MSVLTEIRTWAIQKLYHWGKKEVAKKSTKSKKEGEGVPPKNDVTHPKYFEVHISVNQFFLICISFVFDNITFTNSKNTSEGYVCLWDSYILPAWKNNNSTLQVWMSIYACLCVKDICSNCSVWPFFVSVGLLWYAWAII